jgi:hypothetical protein
MVFHLMLNVEFLVRLGRLLVLVCGVGKVVYSFAAYTLCINMDGYDTFKCEALYSILASAKPMLGSIIEGTIFILLHTH